MGSTPEIILSGEKGEWNTVALAGTQSLQNGELPQQWDEKNREEQEYVAAYIVNNSARWGFLRRRKDLIRLLPGHCLT